MTTTPEEPPVRSEHLADLPAEEQAQQQQQVAEAQAQQPAEEPPGE